MEKEPLRYEIGYLLKSALKEEEIIDFSNKFKDELAKQGGLASTEGKAKKITLAYPIKKETAAIFNWLKFKLMPEKIKEVKKFMDKNSSVLRFLLVKGKGENSNQPSIIKKPKKIEPVLESLSPASEEKIEPKIKEEEIDKKIEELLGE